MNRLDRFMTVIVTQSDDALNRLEDSLEDKEKDIRKISDGVRRLVYQGFFKMAYDYVKSLDNCPKDVSSYFYDLSKKQAEYDHLVLEEQQFGHGSLSHLEGVW